MNRVIVGDCLTILPTLDVDSIDACVTDPPYGIGFMGKKWDTFKPGVVAQPERYTTPIQSDNPNLQGRRRSPAISVSQIEYDRSVAGQREFQSWTEQWAREVLRVLKPGAHLLVCGAPRSFHRMTCGLEDAGFEIRDCIMWVFGQGFPKSLNLKGEWQGWGTALKPAWEPIIVARKPIAKGLAVADNMERHRTGALNIDGCRIDGRPQTGSGAPGVFRLNGQNDRPHHHREGEPSAYRVYNDAGGTNFAMKPGPRGGASAGRWPANLIHDGSDEVIRLFPNDAGAAAPVHKRNGDKFRGTYGAFAGNVDEAGSTFHGDAGSAARFFYCAKTSRKDRNEGCESIDRKPLNWSSGTQSPGTFQAEGTDKTSPNNHPTVKPTSLMRYLVRLVAPPGGTVLDPFNGSGSTGKACVYEGFDYLGIEREPDYAAISEARIAFAINHHREQSAQQSKALA